MADLVHRQSLNQGLVQLLTLNRHPKRNALDTAMCLAIEEALLGAVEEGARVVVLTGDGTVFSAGADLTSQAFADELYPALENMLDTIRTLPIVVIAAVNGPAIGAGTMLAMACDIRLVAEDAYFHVPVVDVGIALDEITIRTLELLVGGARARQMLLTGARLTAAAAVDSGFAVAEGDINTALMFADMCASKAPLTVKQIKMEFAHSSGRPFSREDRATAQLNAWWSEDLQEARRAREEKRRPEFHGK